MDNPRRVLYLDDAKTAAKASGAWEKALERRPCEGDVGYAPSEGDLAFLRSEGTPVARHCAGGGGCPSDTSSHELFRGWWLTFVIHERKWMGSLILEDWSATSPACHELTPDMFKIGLAQAIAESRCVPSALVGWPGVGGCWRARSLLSFVPRLRASLGALGSLRGFGVPSMEALAVVEPPDDAGGSAKQLVFQARGDPEVELFLNGHNGSGEGSASSVEHHLKNCEEHLNGTRAPGEFSAEVPSLLHPFPERSEYDSLSVSAVRLLFRATKNFHDAKPWTAIDNFHPLVVTVPTEEEERQQGQSSSSSSSSGGESRTFVVVVSGNGNWNSRGCYFYASWGDMQRFGTRQPVAHACLQYTSRSEIPFRTLDHVEELGLEVSTAGAKGLEDGFPVLYHSSAPPQRGDTLEHYVELWSTPPPARDLVPMALCLLAVAQFAGDQTKCRVSVARSRREEPSTTAFAPGPHTVAVALGVGLAKAVSVVVEARHVAQDASNSLRTAEEHLASMSLTGTRKELKQVCNYCNKPKSLAEKGKLMACSKCKSVNYCSVDCQRKDWSRHKKMDCQPHTGGD